MNIDPSQPAEELEDEQTEQLETDSAELTEEDVAAKLASREDEDEESPEDGEDEGIDLDDEAVLAKFFKLNGEKLTGKQLREAQMKDADYRQKTAKLAEQSRQAEAIVAQVQQERAQRANQLDVLIGALHREILGDHEQIQGLLESDPHAYLREKARLDARTQQLQAALFHKNQLEQQTTQEQLRQREVFVREQDELLLSAVPKWRDPVKRQAEQIELARYAIDTLGYAPEEINDVQDHRAVVALRKAMLWDKAQKLKASPANKPTPAVVKPGAAPQNNSRRIDPALERQLRKEGTPEAIARLIEMRDR